jgi:hypothetical protein
VEYFCLIVFFFFFADFFHFSDLLPVGYIEMKSLCFIIFAVLDLKFIRPSISPSAFILMMMLYCAVQRCILSSMRFDSADYDNVLIKS